MTNLAEPHRSTSACPHHPSHDGQEGGFLACLKMTLDEIREDLREDLLEAIKETT